MVTHRPLYVKIHAFGGPPRLSHADAIAFVHGGLRGVQLQKLSLAAEEVHTSIITQGVVLGSWSLTRGGVVELDQTEFFFSPYYWDHRFGIMLIIVFQSSTPCNEILYGKC